MAREGRCEWSATLERGPRGRLSGHAGEQRAHVVVGLVIGAREDALDALVRSQQHVGHVSTSQVRERLKHGLAVWTVDMSTLEEHGVDVRVALEVRARALHDCDAAAHAEATLVEREHHAQERARHLAEQLGIVREPMPSWIRESEHPLAQCHFGFPELPPTPASWLHTTFGSVLEVVERRMRLEPNATYRLLTAKRNRGGIELRGELLGKDILTKPQFEAKAGDFLISRRQISLHLERQAVRL